MRFLQARLSDFKPKRRKRRFFFSGTPYGDFDCVPVEASVDYWNNYRLMLNLGWNTCLAEDVFQLRQYVEDPNREVFWTRWVDEGQQRILLLNTDWTEPGNEKTVTLVTPEKRLPIHIPEGKLVCVTVDNCHPNDSGFASMAYALEKVLMEI